METSIQRFYAGNTRGYILAAGFCVLAALACSTLNAAPLNPGDTLFPAPVVAAPSGGSILAGGAPIAFSSPLYSGTLTSTVISGDASNPFGGLTFTYLLTNNISSTDPLERLSIGGYSGIGINAGYVPGGDVPPDILDRQIANNGALIGYTFLQNPPGQGTLAPGQTSSLMVVYTNATSFGFVSASVIDGSPASVMALSPAAVPEPTTVAAAILAALACSLHFMRRFRRSTKTATLLLSSFLALAVSSNARAAALAPGGSLFPAPSSASVTGTVIAGGTPVAFTGLAYSGTLTTTVLSSDPLNTFGGLTFVYQLSNDVTSVDSLERLAINSFSGISVDASYVVVSGGIAPTLIDRPNAVTGDTVGFSFFGAPVGPGRVAPGATSDFLVLRTNAVSFAPTLASVLDGSPSTASSFAPVAVVPEPSSLALLGLGSAGLIWSRRRRR